MSDNQSQNSTEIDLTAEVLQQIGQLCMNTDRSDVTFVVENTKIPAHRFVLSVRSEYFERMLLGGLKESTQKEIKLDVPLEAFKAILVYIYLGRLSLGSMTEENIFETLDLANEYRFEALKGAISAYLTKNLSVASCCAVLNRVRLYSLESLSAVCLTFIDRNATDVLNHPTFNTLSQESLCSLLKRDSFYASEVEIFNAVHNWFKHNPNAEIESVILFVRFTLMDRQQLLNIVRPSAILDPERLLDVFSDMETSKTLPYRGVLRPEENVASLEFNSRTIQGNNSTALLDGNVTNYDVYTSHEITVSGDQVIAVELGMISIINHIMMLLWDNDDRSYSYYVEVSVNQTNWERIIDHTEYMCRSWQFLYFPSRAVRYIKLVGTHNTANRFFHVMAFQAMHKAQQPTLVEGLIAPTYNVATVEMSATVIEGVDVTRNALLNDDSGYTEHFMPNGCIIIQLSQPYYIDSMRLQLWNDNVRTYSFCRIKTIGKWLLTNETNSCVHGNNLHSIREQLFLSKLSALTTQRTSLFTLYVLNVHHRSSKNRRTI